MENKKLSSKYQEGKHWEKHPTVYAERFVKFLKEKDFNGTIIDLGCGNGRDINVFTKNGFNALGIDNSEKEIKLAGSNFPNCKFEVQDIENLKFEDKSVNAFFMINVIHYVNKEKALKEVYRCLKPGGYIFIHFNLEITDKDGNTDYEQDEVEILNQIVFFENVHEEIFKRVDTKPKEHTHEIMELILRKYD